MFVTKKRHLLGSLIVVALAAGCNSRLPQNQQLEIQNLDPNELRIAIDHSNSIRFRKDSPTFGITLSADEPPVNLHYDIPLLAISDKKPTVLAKLVRSDRQLSLFKISAKNQPTLNKVLGILDQNRQKGIGGNTALNVKLDNACSTLDSPIDRFNSELNLTAPERVTVWIKTVKNGYYQKLLDHVDIAEQQALPNCDS